MEALLHKFYKAFSEKDGEAMAACYHDEVDFKDPVLGPLKGEEARNMWRMLTKGAQDLEVKTDFVTADEQKGVVKWEAEYTFSKTGRKVKNVVVGKFKFKEGLIISHEDSFNFTTWLKQAFGLTGFLLGKFPFFREKVRKGARESLARFSAQRK
ncbi:nuclear transport factor 2 family protein [Marinilongibacter aquaticus]|uniref:nuclear transport factor 2 family protein n=1 Tax=Marinilongibacter aquaticus TaxID=2975157 RepID=UPI0021BCFF62|nr:nuclear transport factor 2 family protein [Marinilongibacter aquaticus]UBM59896.1 nuclear transport factor 2 family protein [Marinilongibacter aquaticus]